MSILSSILKDPPRPIPELNARVPRELWQVVRRCLAKDPEKRLQSAKDLRNELEEVKQSLESGELSPESSRASASAIPGEGHRQAVPGPHRRVWAAATTLVVLASAIAAWRYASTMSEPEESRALAASFSILTTQAGIEQHPSLSPDGRWMVYASDETGNLDIYLQGVGAQTPINLTKDSPANDDQPKFSPDGERIAFRSGRDGGGLYVMGRTGELVKKVSDRGFNPAWSPDGQKLAYSTQGIAERPGNRTAAGAEIWVLTLATGETRRLTDKDAMQPAWSPDGSRIAYWGYAPQSRNREVWTVSVTGGEPTRITDNPAIDWNPVWTPDGRNLYFGSDRGGSLGLWRVGLDPRSGEASGSPEPIQIPSTWAASFGLSGDGSRMVFASYHPSGQVYAADFNAQSGTVAPPVQITHGTRIWDYLDVSPDGQRLVMSTLYPREDVFVADASGGNLRQITDDAAADRGVRWSPDGTRILYYAGKPGELMHIFTMGSDGSTVRQITDVVPEGGTSWVFPQWSPDGSRIAAFNINDNGYLLERSDIGPWGRSALPRVGAKQEAFTPGAWTHDGKRIVGVTSVTGQLVVYDIAGQHYDETGLLGFGTQGGIAWLPDGRRILAARSGDIVLVDLATRQISTVVDEPVRRGARMPRLSADGRRLFYLLGDNESDIALMTMK